MQLRRGALVALFSLLATLVASQQGVLNDGNSKLPACAQTCPVLLQAAMACNGVTSDSQGVWICFCQSGYLTMLPSSDTGICDSTCLDPADGAQVSTWYKSNCGSDFGKSEHPNTGPVSSSQGPTAPTGAVSSGASSAATASNTPGSSSSNIGSGLGSSSRSGDWWSNHGKWIIMLIVLAVALPIIAVIAVCLKRRHERKRDHLHGGFNAGITSRRAPMNHPNLNQSGAVAQGGLDGSGANSPARTRDAFMPYGYGYNRSESRIGSRQAVNDGSKSPLARGGTPVGELEKQVKAGAKESKRTTARDHDGEDGIETEKNSG